MASSISYFSFQFLICFAASKSQNYQTDLSEISLDLSAMAQMTCLFFFLNFLLSFSLSLSLSSTSFSVSSSSRYLRTLSREQFLLLWASSSRFPSSDFLAEELKSQRSNETDASMLEMLLQRCSCSSSRYLPLGLFSLLMASNLLQLDRIYPSRSLKYSSLLSCSSLIFRQISRQDLSVTSLRLKRDSMDSSFLCLQSSISLRLHFRARSKGYLMLKPSLQSSPRLAGLFSPFFLAVIGLFGEGYCMILISNALSIWNCLSYLVLESRSPVERLLFSMLDRFGSWQESQEILRSSFSSMGCSLSLEECYPLQLQLLFALLRLIYQKEFFCWGMALFLGFSTGSISSLIEGISLLGCDLQEIGWLFTISLELVWEQDSYCSYFCRLYELTTSSPLSVRQDRCLILFSSNLSFQKALTSGDPLFVQLCLLFLFSLLTNCLKCLRSRQTRHCRWILIAKVLISSMTSPSLICPCLFGRSYFYLPFLALGIREREKVQLAVEL